MKRPSDVRRHIGLAGQYAAVDQNLTGRENLRLIGQPRPARAPADPSSRGRAPGAVRADRRRRPSGADLLGRHAPSPGHRRRARPRAARAVPRRADDRARPASRNELWAMIRELVADGTTVLLTTQYLEEADRLAHRIAVVDDGRVIANDTRRRSRPAREHGRSRLDIGTSRCGGARGSDPFAAGDGPGRTRRNRRPPEDRRRNAPAHGRVTNARRCGPGAGAARGTRAEHGRCLPRPHRPPRRGRRALDCIRRPREVPHDDDRHRSPSH